METESVRTYGIMASLRGNFLFRSATQQALKLFPQGNIHDARWIEHDAGANIRILQHKLIPCVLFFHSTRIHEMQNKWNIIQYVALFI